MSTNNTITVVLAALSQKVITTLKPETADLANFSSIFGDDVPPALTVRCPMLGSTGEATARDANATEDFDYEVTSGTAIDEVDVTVRELSISWSVGRNELLKSGLSGSIVDQLAIENTRKYLEKAYGIVYAPLTHANYGTTVQLAANATHTKDTFATLRKALNKAGVPKADRFFVGDDITDLALEQASLVYDKEALMEGSVGRIAGLNIFESPYIPAVYDGTGASRKRLVGFAGGKSGLGVAAFPALDAAEIQGDMVYNETIKIGSLPVQFTAWVARGKKRLIFNLNGYVGSTVGQAGAIKRVVIADPAS